VSSVIYLAGEPAWLSSNLLSNVVQARAKYIWLSEGAEKIEESSA